MRWLPGQAAQLVQATKRNQTLQATQVGTSNNLQVRHLAQKAASNASPFLSRESTLSFQIQNLCGVIGGYQFALSAEH
jgi:hypothetical protein